MNIENQNVDGTHIPRSCTADVAAVQSEDGKLTIQVWNTGLDKSLTISLDPDEAADFAYDISNALYEVMQEVQA